MHRLDIGATPIVKREDVPSKRLNEVNYFDLLKLVEAVSDAN